MMGACPGGRPHSSLSFAWFLSAPPLFLSVFGLHNLQRPWRPAQGPTCRNIEIHGWTPHPLLKPNPHPTLALACVWHAATLCRPLSSPCYVSLLQRQMRGTSPLMKAVHLCRRAVFGWRRLRQQHRVVSTSRPRPPPARCCSPHARSLRRCSSAGVGGRLL